MREIISSVDNKQIKNLIQLQKRKRARDEQGLFVCEGCRMFEEARDDKRGLLEKIYLSESFYINLDDPESYVGDNPYEVVKSSVFNQAAETMAPQGVLAVIRKPEYCLDDVISNPVRRLLILEDIQDPGNLGTLIRTAEAAGITGVIMSSRTADIFNPKVIRSTMGSLYRVPYVYCDSLTDTLGYIQKQGVSVYAAYLRNGVDYRRVDYGKSYALMIGNEGNGLSDEAAELADMRVYIRMQGEVESLNAAIAGAILMFEAARNVE